MDGRINRLKEVLGEIGITRNSFATSCGVSPSNLKKMLDGEQTITDRTLHKITDTFPKINIEWLKTGKGQMLIDPNLNTASNVQQINASKPKTERADLVPLLPVDAMAGSLSGLSESVMLRDCRWIKTPVSGADFAIQVTGDSMEPQIHNGTIIYIKRMTGAFIPWGNIVVLDTYDGAVVKQIYPCEHNKDYIIARSVNQKYPDYEIEKTSILAIYRILGGSFINTTM